MRDAKNKDEELMDAVWEMAFNGLDKAYELKHDLKQTGASETDRQWAQGKADAFRTILATMRGHSRFVFKPGKGNEASGEITDEIRETAVRLGIPMPQIPTILRTPDFDDEE